MYTFKNVKKSELGLYINGYYDTLLAPMDDMWEESIIAKSEYFRIDEEETIGFFAINDENILTQFYIVDLKYEDVLSKIVLYYQITQAYVSSYDPVFRAASNKFKQASTVNSLLYHEVNEVEIVSPLENLILKEAVISDLEAVLTYHNQNDMDGPWLKPYLSNLINNAGLMLLISDNTIIGTGEYRLSKSSQGIANIGMTIDKGYRKKGLGAYVLSYMKDYCNQIGYETICGTDVDNIASQKVIEKSGFECYHKIYNVWF